MNIKTVVAVLFLAVSAYAGTVTAPVMYPESQRVLWNVPGVGQDIFALPCSVAEVWWEDIAGLGDQDYNDGVQRISFWPWGNGLVRITWEDLGGNAAYRHTFSVPQFAPIGSVVTLSMTVLDTGNTWYTGDGHLNLDWQPHAWVSERCCGCVPNVPEPSTAALAGGVLLLVAWKRNWR